MRAVLNAEAGQVCPTSLVLDPGQTVTLGRNQKNSLVIQDERASRRHAEILWEKGAWHLRDLGTLNGTRVDGERLEGTVALHSGQIIGIGSARLRLMIEEPSACAQDTSKVSESAPARTALDTLPELEESRLDASDLSTLCHFMAGSIQESEPRELIGQALEACLRQTGASLAGFLSLDKQEPLPKIVRPILARVDVQLSRQLTEAVQRSGHAVWLAAGKHETPTSESLLAFRDALCMPLQSDDTSLGALHIYRADRTFREQETQFCQLVAGFLANNLARLRTHRRLEAENSRLRSHAQTGDQLIGHSTAMTKLRQLIARLAPHSGAHPPPVLIQGESGVGKELVALALHGQSLRREGPLVVVNCAAISPTLLEAELFGYRKGAFSGAEHDHPGLFQQADEGTLFLDEVGELTLECQAKLLRVIEGKSFRPVGATAEVQTDVRIIAATHRILEEQAQLGRFRQDLYFRLAGLTLRVPPLREHVEDIAALTEYFLGKLAVECGRQVALTEAALRQLESYDWPGNVRQLRSVLEYAVILTDKDLLEPSDLVLPSPSLKDQPVSLNLEELEGWAIRQALRRSQYNISQAARLLGIGRETLTNKMKKYGIQRDPE